MKQLTNAAFYVLFLLVVALTACNDPSSIGSDLLTGDELELGYTDTITMQARTVQSDSFTIWNPAANNFGLTYYPVGNLIDPIFGRTTSSIFAQVSLNATNPTGTNFPIPETGRVLDSLVLILSYREDLCYGKLDEPWTLEVYELDEQLSDTVSYSNKDSFAVKPTPIGSLTFTPNIEDSVTVVVPQKDSFLTEKLPPQVRIHMTPEFANRLFTADTSILYDDDAFYGFFKGIWLKSATENKGMLNFIMRSQNTNLRLYYKNPTGTDTTYGQYNFRIYSGDPTTVLQRHDYAGSTVAPFITTPDGSRNDSILFLQGINGVNFVLDLPYLESLQGRIVNKAQLILPILSMPGDDPAYDPVAQIIVQEMLSDTTVATIDDVALAEKFSEELFDDYFGGVPTDDDEYRINLSAHIQKIIDGEAANRLLVTILLKPERPARVVLGGPGHPTHPARLKVSFTKY